MREPVREQMQMTCMKMEIRLVSWIKDTREKAQ